ncbi:MAG: arginine deiminase-related protein [Bacteroidota bacterium]
MSQVSFSKPDAPQQLTTGHLLMVRPAAFGFNPETAADNAFQRVAAPSQQQKIAKAARNEFDELVQKLRAAGVVITVAEDSATPIKTDAVFPNNWISTHADGLVVTYPMLSEIRRQERRQAIIDLLAATYSLKRLVTLDPWELQGRILEGTGSMILDRRNRVVYACISQRTNPTALEEWAELMRYQVCSFTAQDQNGKAIYHTNVMMALGSKQAVICLDALPFQHERQLVLEQLEQSGHEVIAITQAQVAQFAGNMLEVVGKNGPIWVMSSQAYASLTDEQIARLKSNNQSILHSPLTTIETYGGGSARCMLAEVFLPKK